MAYSGADQGQALKRLRFTPISGASFKDARLIAGYTREQAARLLFVSERTVRNWEAGRRGVPYSAYKLVKILSGYELPGEAWQGWCLRGGALWSPEQRAFRPHELGWWGLTCAMARSWLQRYGADGSPARVEMELTAEDLGLASKATLPHAEQSAVSRSTERGGASQSGRSRARTKTPGKAVRVAIVPKSDEPQERRARVARPQAPAPLV